MFLKYNRSWEALKAVALRDNFHFPYSYIYSPLFLSIENQNLRISHHSFRSQDLVLTNALQREILETSHFQ